MTLRRKGMSATALAILFLAGPAFAQQADAKAEFDAGQKLFDGGRQADALPHFRAAFASSKSPDARLMVARCLVALGKTAEAYEEMATTTREATTRAETDPKYVRTRDSAAAEMAVLERRVGKLVVALADPGVGATVTLDGAPLGPERLGVPVAVQPGKLTIEATHAGDTPVRREVTIGAGETGTSVLADDFPGGDPGDLWTLNSNGNTVAEAGGEAVITLPSSSPSGSWGELDSHRAYDLRGDSLSIERATATNPLTSAQSWFGTGYDKNYLQIVQQKGQIRFGYQLAGMTTNLTSIVFDPVAHRHWRLREDGQTTFWETSSDGAAWTIRAQIASATLFPMSLMWVWFGAGTDGGEVNPGAAHFDRLNGGGLPKEKYCPISTFTDDFNDGAKSLAWGRGWEDKPGMLAEAGGALTVTQHQDGRRLAGARERALRARDPPLVADPR